jgi:uncharacterized protein YfeS
LITARETKDEQLKKAYEAREYEESIKKEIALIKREDRLENVERIARANAYQQKKIMEKIELDKLKTEALMAEKASMLQTRFAVRRQADQQKSKLMKTVELMKKKGRFDKEELAKLGINVKTEGDERTN